jgi:hypothetical protein
LKVDERVGVEMQRAAIFEQDFDATVLGAEAIASEKRHRRRGRLRLTIPLEHGCAVNKRDMRRGLALGVLSVRRLRTH